MSYSWEIKVLGYCLILGWVELHVFDLESYHSLLVDKNWPKYFPDSAFPDIIKGGGGGGGNQLTGV